MVQLGTLQCSFLFLNIIFWAIGIGLVGFVSWTLSSLPSSTDFLSAAFGFLYACLLLGIFIAITGLLGCLGGLFRGVLLLKIYIGFMIAFVFVEIGLVIAVYVESDEIPSVIADTWTQLNNDTKFEIQKSLECCGIRNYTEYSTEITSLPESCFRVYDTLSVSAKAETLLFTSACLDQIQSWLEKNLPIWASILALSAIIQVSSMLVSGLVLKEIGIKRKVTPLDDQLSRRSSMSSHNTNADNISIENDVTSIASSKKSTGSQNDDHPEKMEGKESDPDQDSGLHHSSAYDVERNDDDGPSMGAFVALHALDTHASKEEEDKHLMPSQDVIDLQDIGDEDNIKDDVAIPTERGNSRTSTPNTHDAEHLSNTGGHSPISVNNEQKEDVDHPPNGEDLEDVRQPQDESSQARDLEEKNSEKQDNGQVLVLQDTNQLQDESSSQTQEQSTGEKGNGQMVMIEGTVQSQDEYSSQPQEETPGDQGNGRGTVTSGIENRTQI